MYYGIFKNILEYITQDMSSFHTPSHKNFNIFQKNLTKFLQFDLTELDETDNLYNPKSSILFSESFAAKIFGTKKTLFSTGGNTLCIQTMLKLCAPNGGKILCGRNVHKSVISAIALLGIDPIWILPKQKKINNFAGEICFNDLKKAIISNEKILGIFLTSPDYYGTISDIKNISALAKTHGIPLIVDNAHGSHLKFLKNDIHPITLGADMCADSAHKTLPVMTGGAFLHINNEIFLNDAKSSMALFGSTSPSFPILASLDACCNILNEYGKKLYYELEKKVFKIKKTLKSLNLLAEFTNCDPTRIVFETSKIGISGENLHKYLKKFKINSEFYDKNYLVLIPSPFNTQKDWSRLESALKNLNKNLNLTRNTNINTFNFKYFLPKKITTIREALFTKSRQIPIDDSKNKILAEIICPDQPSIPPIMPGELLDEQGISILKFFGVSKVKVIDKI